MKTKDKLTPGEQKIQSALRGSFLVVVVVIIAAAATYFFTRPAEESLEVKEAEVAAPVHKKVAEKKNVPPVIHFTDITRESGIEFQHVNGAYGDKLLPETMAGGLAFFDYDNDGDADLYIVNSTEWPSQSDAKPHSAKLYQNDGTGHFKDVTEEAGLTRNIYGMGVAVGDFDQDGWRDLYLSNLGKNILFKNNQGHFVDVTEAAGVAGNPEDWSTAATFLDYDRDGDLDLFAANYVTWSPEIDSEIDFRVTGLGRSYGAPNHHQGAMSRFFRNEGDGRFTEISQAAGVAVFDQHSGKGVGKTLGVIPVDYDRDGWLDLAVANDTTRNFLFRNLGDGRFEEIGMLEGIAFDQDGKATGGMGIDAAFYRNDRELGIAVGNFANEMSSLYVTMEGKGPLVDEAILEGFGPDSRLSLTFGILFMDADLDGRLDLFQANGHLENDINRVQPSQHYAQPAQLFWNCGEDCDTRFIQLEESGDITQPMVGRGAAYADIDGDGDLDIAVHQNGRSVVLLRNDQKETNHWLRVKLEGSKGNRDALGALLVLKAGGQEQKRRVNTTKSYLSQSEPTVTFGLGKVAKVDELQVVWPEGDIQMVQVDRVDQLIQVRQQ